MLSPDFEEFYKNTPVENIPWYKIVPEYLKKLVESGTIKPCKTLSLGCGLGTQEIYLADRGFDVTALDISETAIKFAKEKAKRRKVSIKFFDSDAADLSFLGNEKFDFILEWALIHCMPLDTHKDYLKELARHVNDNAFLVQRSFSKRDPKCQNGVSKSHLKGINHHFDRIDIKNLYSGWEILEFATDDTAGKYFDQYLMRKKK